MKFNYYYRGKRVTKKELESYVGKARVERVLSDAKQTIQKDPNIALDWVDGISLELLSC